MAENDFPHWVLELASSLRGASYLRLATPAHGAFPGTELTLVVEGRPFEFGRIAGGRGRVWVAPVENLGEGILVATHKGAAVEFVVKNGVIVSGRSSDPDTNHAVERLVADAPEGRRVRLFGWCLEMGTEPTPGTCLPKAFLSFGLYPQPGPDCGASDSNFNVEVECPDVLLYTTDGSGYRILDGRVQLI